MYETIQLGEERYTFLDFLELTEGISPRKTDYEESSDGQTRYAKFIAGEDLFLCVISKTARPGWYDIGFGRHIDGKSTEPSPENFTMTTQLPTQKFFDVFGKVMYVILDMVKSRPEVSRLRFTGGYRAIADFYRVLMNNQIFVRKLREFGFELDDEMMQKYGSGVFILKNITKYQRKE